MHRSSGQYCVLLSDCLAMHYAGHATWPGPVSWQPFQPPLTGDLASSPNRIEEALWRHEVSTGLLQDLHPPATRRIGLQSFRNVPEEARTVCTPSPHPAPVNAPMHGDWVHPQSPPCSRKCAHAWGLGPCKGIKAVKCMLNAPGFASLQIGIDRVSRICHPETQINRRGVVLVTDCVRGKTSPFVSRTRTYPYLLVNNHL